ncbi:MAG TPA: beta-galactosidase, partial [Chthonomonadales bacterium]|nr:beta-galactosidase [Chthonomonadales bacterium]
MLNIRLHLVLLAACFAGLALSHSRHAVDVARGRERTLFDADWRFHRGDVAGSGLASAGITSWSWKADDSGSTDAAEMAAPDLKLTAVWKLARPGEDTFHGRRGFSWYRARLGDVPGPHRSLHFDGVDDNATVYVNGVKLIYHRGWSEPFDVPLDSVWKEGGPNVAAVLVENTYGVGGIGPAYVQSGDSDDARGPALPGYNDSSWRTVHLPHDYVVEGAFTPEADTSHGSLPVMPAWYRKRFTIPSADVGRRVWIDFDGIYRDSRVWLNGKFLGRHQSGYTGFRYDITKTVRYGGVNTLAVRVDPRMGEGWWYEGGGIYRHVWLNESDPLHVAPWGVYVASTPDSTGQAHLSIQTHVLNQESTGATYRVVSEVRDSANHKVASVSTVRSLGPDGQESVTQAMDFGNARLWSLEDPYLYKLVTSVIVSGRTVDSVITPFGVRTIRFDAQQGFFLNGKHVKLKGACNHQD